MSVQEAAFLFLTGAVAAALNSVAGGGSFLTVPALIFIGADPVRANATSTMALWPAWFATSTAMRGELAPERRTLLLFGIPGIVGGVLGAWVLVLTPSKTFVQLLPFLLLVATLLFAFGDRLRRLLVKSTASSASAAAMMATQLIIAIYGGYFGGGMGFLVLALLSLHGLTDLHRMNAVKSILSIIVNGVALATFVFAQTIDWKPGLVMAVGGMLGGYVGPLVARRVPPLWLRRFVITVGVVMTTVFFARAYGR